MDLTIKQLCKSYGNSIALKNVDMVCQSGWTYCLLGRNGAGKSTLINILANLIGATSGEVYFDKMSYPGDENEIKKQIGLSSQYEQLIADLNARDYLHWVGLLYGLRKNDISEQIINLLSFFFDNGENLAAPCGGYSSGMKKKLAFCAAVIHKPALLLLDEPFANLDPVAASKLCRFLNAYRNQQRLIFVSSHDLLYVDKIATHIGVIDNSALVYSDTINSFKDGGTKTLDQELFKYLQPANDNSAMLNAIT